MTPERRLTWDRYCALRAAKRRVSLDIRENFGAGWKVFIGHTVWDNRVGALLDLEDTPGWELAVKAARDALWHLEVQEYHAQFGILAIWRQRREIWNVDVLRRAR